MGKFLQTAILLLGTVLGMPSLASAQEYNHKITVHAVVPELRVIYLDKTGNIIRIVGNTANNITPSILDSNNQPAALSLAIQDQYDNFLRLHGGKLQASKTYNVNPVSVSTATNSLTIEVSNTGLSLVDLTIE